MKFQDHWSPELKEAWEKAPSSHRFEYKTNRLVMALFWGQLLVLWSLFLFAAITISEWNSQLTAFTVLYGVMSILLVLQLVRWRAFVLLSVIVFGKKTLYWVHGREEFQARRSTLDPEKMGLTRADTWNRFEASLDIHQKEGNVSKLYLYRPFAYLDNLEGLMERMLEHISKEPRKRKSKR